jgi:hypothetical protein
MAAKGSTRRGSPGKTVEARENRLISLAMDLAEQQLLDGTASSQIITEFVKRGSTKERIEKEILSLNKDLVKAKTEAIQSQKKSEELFDKALKAMKRYSGEEVRDEEL